MIVQVQINKSYGEPYAVYVGKLGKKNIYPLLTQREKNKINKSYEKTIDVIVSRKLYDAIISEKSVKVGLAL